MITYNHEKYIEQAIKGVLMQNCNFEVELIIADDCSPDKTENIINQIIDIHPNASWLKYIKHESNIGMMPNFIFALKMAEGKYIALCEGDDYWTDPLKLQKQVDFLEANPQFALCHHRVDILKGDKLERWDYCPYEVTDIYDLALGNHISTLSCMFRKENLEYFSSTSELGDYSLHMHNASFGNIKFFDSAMGVYREGVGIYSSKSRENNLQTLLRVIDYLSKKYKDDMKLKHNFNMQCFELYLELAEIMITKEKETEALKYFNLAQEINPNPRTINLYAFFYSKWNKNIGKKDLLNYLKNKIIANKKVPN